MQLALVLLLIGVLAAAVVSFAVMGFLQARRRGALTRSAHEMQMRFSPEDPFGVACRYAQFAIMGCGHSPHAANVTYGRMGGWPVRAFDFRYEVGHGTRRMTRHYAVVVVEMDRHMPPVLLWRDRDIQRAPLAGRQCDGPMGSWRYRGSRAMAAAVVEAWGDEECSSFETSGNSLMFCVPARASRRAVGWWMEKAASVAESLRGSVIDPAASRSQGVETPRRA